MFSVTAIAVGLTGCGSTGTQTGVEPLPGLDGVYVGKAPIMYNLVREVEVPIRSVLMPDGKTWIGTIQLVDGSISSTARGQFVTPTKWVGRLKGQSILFTKITEGGETVVEFAPDGRSATTRSTVRGLREPIVGKIYKVGTPEAARLEREFPAMHAALRRSRDERNLNLGNYHIANYTTATKAEIDRSVLFYGPMVAKVHPPVVFLYAFGGYDRNGKPLINFGRAPILVPMEEVGLRQDNELIDVPKDNPVAVLKPGVTNRGIFARAPLLP